jgi:ribosomal protein S25
MVEKMQKMAEQASAWNADFPQGTEVAVLQDDSARRIMAVSGPAMVGNDGLQACVKAGDAEDQIVPLTRIRKRAVEIRKGKDQLRVDLTDVERLEMGDKLADLYQQSSGLEGELAQAKKQIQGKIEAVKNAIEANVNLLRAGYEIRGVTVETVRDFDLQTVVKRRKDIGTVIETRAMREDELQAETSLFPELHQEPEVPEAEETQEAEDDADGKETPAESKTLDVGEQEIQKAVAVLKETRRASVSGIQRRLNVSFIRAAQIMEALEVRGIVGPAKKDGGTRDIVEGALEAEAEAPEGKIKEGVEDLLERAEEAYPESDFVPSVREWYEEKGFITQAQQEALERIANGERK